MPQTSRFNNNEIETIMNEILIVLENHNADKDLSLIALGNVLSHIFNHSVHAEHKRELVETFSNVLRKSVS